MTLAAPAGLRRFPIAPVALVAVLASGVALAQGQPAQDRAVEPAKWDQDRTTAAAKDFAANAGKVYDELYRSQLSYTIGTGKSKDYQRLKDTVRLIRSESRRLARQLEGGKGRDETLPIYERMMVEVRNAQEIARRLDMSETLLNKIAAAGDALRRLTPYYAPNPEAPTG